MLLNKIASFRVIENVGHRLLPNISILQKKYNELSTEKVDAEDKDISKAMKAYLTRAKEHEEFMKRENYEYQIGKRHLANMMGEDPETFTQEDVDNAIAYLFPSGIYDKKARPVMKPPEEIFPQRKAAEFDKSGRPFHYLFYTSRPNFYQLLHTIVENVRQLNKFEDSMNKKGILPDSNLTLDLTGYQWLDKNELESLLLESIGEKDYESFVLAIENLYKLPYSYRIQEFIKKYMKPLMKQTNTSEAPKPSYDESGRAYITVYECLRKAARGHVTIRSPGTGNISINGEDITYFHDKQSREQVSCFEYLEFTLLIFSKP